MNSEILNKVIVLSLNRSWMPIGHRSVKQAIIALMGGSESQPPALGLDIEYEKLANGEWNFETPAWMNPVKWADWIKLPIRDFDFVVHTPKQSIRVPTVMVSTQYDKLRVVNPSFSRDAIYERDGGICQFTGEFVGREGGNLDHIVAQSKGGRDEFENVIWSSIRINSLKADRDLHETGLKLIRAPKAPKPVPVSATIRHARHHDWKHFMVNR